MPIIDVEIVGAHDPRPDPAALARALAAATGSAPRGTWLRLRRLPEDDYGEGEPGHPLPVFVTVLRAQLPAESELESEAAEIARSVAKACGRAAENVHVLYLPPAAGRIAFGGTLRRS